MNLYMFEYLNDGHIERERICAANSLDAFDMFRADNPAAPITYAWVELFGVR